MNGLVLTERGVAVREDVRRRMEEPPEPLRRLSASEARRRRDLRAEALP